MELERFVHERRASWTRLERLLDEAESLPDQRLGTARLQELLGLYRQACSDLNEARSYTANAELLSRLNDLSGRGYRFVYRRPKARGFAVAAWRFLLSDAPAVFRRRRGLVLQGTLAMLLGALLGFVAVIADAGNGERLIPPQFFTESPKQRVEKIEAGEERIDSVEEALHFGVSLYTHNIQVSFLAFSLGATTIVGGWLLLFWNGVTLGAVAAMYVLDGVSGFFLAWVGPHGALEIPAIVFGGAAGLLAGRALLLPGELSTASSLRAALPDVWRMMLTTALTLVVAGLIEGSFSQFSSKTFPTALKIGVAGLLFIALLSYLFLRRPAADTQS